MEQEKIKLQSEFEIQKDDKKVAQYKNSNQEIKVPFLNLIKYSNIVQDEVMNSFILHQFFDKLKKFQEASQIREESVATFVRLLNDEEVELKKEEFIDLFKLTDFFKVDSLKNCLKKCLINRANDINFMLDLKITQEQTDDPEIFLNDEFSAIIEANVKNNINQCLLNDKIKNISISSVNRMMNDCKENISNDVLYQYIVQSIEERYILFQYLDIEKLTDVFFEDFFSRYTSDCNDDKSYYYDFLPKNIMYIKKLMDQIGKLQKANRNLENQIKQFDINMQTKTEKIFRQIPEFDKFLFFSTGAPDLLLNGIEVELQMTYNPEQCSTYLKSILKNRIENIDKYNLLIFLAGGIPFIGGTLNDMYFNCNGPYVKNYIYGILVPPASEIELNEDILNFYDIKKVINFFFSTTSIGLCDICCLIGYLNNDGILNDKFLKSCAAVIHFPPLITSLNRIIEKNNVKNIDVVVVTSTLHTFFSYLLKQCTPSDEIFDFTLKCCNYIINIENENKRFPMVYVNDYHNSKFLSNLKLKDYVYFWEGDSYKNYIYYSIEPFDPLNYDDDETNKNKFISFDPIDPLSIRTAYGCTIFKGNNHNCLFIPQSYDKIFEDSNKVLIFDPLKSFITTVNIDKLAPIHDHYNINNTTSLINRDKIKQVIYVCFDNSYIMRDMIGGNYYFNSVRTELRSNIATQYLLCFSDEIVRYKTACIYGLINFNNQIKKCCSFSSPFLNFAEKGLKNFYPRGNAHLWDAISFACDKLIEYALYPNGSKKFENAINRIIVISAGIDNESKMNLELVAKKMIENNILVDSIVINTDEKSKEKLKELAALCHITGGLAFNPQTIKDGINILQKNAFIKYEERTENINPIIENDPKTVSKMLKINQINHEFIQNSVKCAKFDTDVQNKFVIQTCNESKIFTLKHIYSKNYNKIIQHPRKRRIMKEIYEAAVVSNPNSPKYDPNIIVYLSSCIDTWQVFLKGEDLTPYEGKWFYILATFPELYPNEAPIFRFISIPYHLNISIEGNICIDVLNNDYEPSMHVIDLIQQIKELFILQNLENAVHTEIYKIFFYNRDEYDRLARESAKNVGKDDYKSFLLPKISIEDSVDENFYFI